jgi:hypothetical protein
MDGTETRPPVSDLGELLGKFPKYVTREKAAEIVSTYFFEQNPRTMERWRGLRWIILNRRASGETEALFRAAQERAAAAPPAVRRRRDRAPSEPITQTT